VDQILHAHDAVLAKVLLDDGVVSEGDTLLVAVSRVSRCNPDIGMSSLHFAVSTFVD
jgi:hypothetical protein